MTSTDPRLVSTHIRTHGLESLASQLKLVEECNTLSELVAKLEATQ